MGAHHRTLLPQAFDDGVAWTNSEWREHDATPESLEPEPKGEGTAWQRAIELIRSGRTHPNLDTHNEATPRALARRGWATIGSDDEPRFTQDVAGLFFPGVVARD